MGKAVENSFAFADFLNSQTIVFLIQEKSCFLAIDNINKIFDSVFRNLYVDIKRLSNEILNLGRPSFCRSFASLLS